MRIGSEAPCPVGFNRGWVCQSSGVVGRVHEKGSVAPPTPQPRRRRLNMEVDRLLFLRPAYTTRAPINYPPIFGTVTFPTRTWPPNILIEKYIQTGV